MSNQQRFLCGERVQKRIEHFQISRRESRIAAAGGSPLSPPPRPPPATGLQYMQVAHAGVECSQVKGKAYLDASSENYFGGRGRGGRRGRGRGGGAWAVCGARGTWCREQARIEGNV